MKALLPLSHHRITLESDRFTWVNHNSPGFPVKSARRNQPDESKASEQCPKSILGRFPAVALLGPRQVGKTTLALALAAELKLRSVYVDLELPSDSGPESVKVRGTKRSTKSQSRRGLSEV